MSESKSDTAESLFDIEAVKEEYRKRLVEVMGANFTPEKIKADVMAHLTRQRMSIVSQLMGFKGHFDRFEIDHCNGRAGESAAGDYLRTRAGQAVYQWLDKQAGELPDLPEEAIRSLHKEYLKTYKETLRKELVRLATEKATEDAKQISGECLDQIHEIEL